MDPGSSFFFNFCDFCFSWTMDHALSHLEYFDCQGHNSLNFGPIFKILVPQHISFPRPFFFIYWTSTWHMPRGQKRVLKVLHEKQKSLKLKKILLPGFIPAVFFLNIISLYQKKYLKNKKKKLFSSYIEFLGPKAETYQALLLIISWSERLLEYAIFLGYLSGHFEVLWAKIRWKMAKIELE